MADQTARLEAATLRAEIGSGILFRFSNDAVDGGAIPTQSGDIQNLKSVILGIQTDGANKISIATTIYPTTAAGIAGTTNGAIFLVQSSATTEIYAVYQNNNGTAVDTGKRALDGSAVTNATTAATQAAASAQAAANTATARVAGFHAPSSTDPTTRDDGSALQVGDTYFNTSTNSGRTYSSSGWILSSVNGNDLNAAIGTREPAIAPGTATQFWGGDKAFHDLNKSAVGLPSVDNTSDANKPVSTAQQNALDLKANLSNPTFTGNVGGITAAMVGLGNVNNTSDANKPVSTAQAAAIAALNAANLNYTSTASGAVTRTIASRLGDTFNVRDFGAVPGSDQSSKAVNVAKINAAIAALSALGVANGAIYELQISDLYVVGGARSGSNNSIIQPRSNVRLRGLGGCIKVADGENTAAGATGWNLIYPAENTDAAVYNFEVIDLRFDGNGANNLNTTLRRNSMIGIMSGSDILVRGCRFDNCPGFHVSTMGKDGAIALSRVKFASNVIHNVATAIPGNTLGSTPDHSSVYLHCLDSSAEFNFFYNDTVDTVGTAIEIHGNNSKAIGNLYENYLNLINFGGYDTNLQNVLIAGNVGANVEMLCRAYANGTYTLDGIVVENNHLTIRTTSLSQFDFGIAVFNTLINNVTSQNNTYEYVGAAPQYQAPVYYLKGVANMRMAGDDMRGTPSRPVLVDSMPTGARLVISGCKFDDVNTSSGTPGDLVSVANNTNTMALIEISRNSIRKCKNRVATLATDTKLTRLIIKDNTITETPDLVSIPSNTGFGQLDIQHSGDTPSSGQFSTSFSKLSVGSQIICLDTGTIWRAKKPVGNGLLNREDYGTAPPTAGVAYVGDLRYNTTPAATGTAYEGWICVTSGTPGTWRPFGALV